MLLADTNILSTFAKIDQLTLLFRPKGLHTSVRSVRCMVT